LPSVIPRKIDARFHGWNGHPRNPVILKILSILSQNF
jgi:hypothetical protein